MLDDGPGDGKAVERGRAAADFVEKDQARGSGVIEDGRDFAHLDEKRGAPTREIVAGADAREDAVGDGQLGLASGNEGAHLSHEDDERGLAEIGGFAAHVGAGNQKKLLPARLEAKIVGNEALAFLTQKLFDDGVASAYDEEFAGGVEFGPRIAAIGGQLCKSTQDVELRYRRGSAAKPRSLRGDPGTDVDEELALDFQDALVGGEDFAFVLRGSEMQIRFRDFDVVAKNLIETNLERSDVGALALPVFHGGNDMLAVLAEIAKFVKLGVIAAANYPRIGGQGRRLIGNGAFEALADIRELVDLLVEVAKKFAATNRGRREKILQHRQLRKRLAKRDQLAGRGKTQCDAAGEPLKVEDSFELFANFAANHDLLYEMRDCIQAGLDGFAADQRAKDPGAQQARAHARNGNVKRGNQRGRAAGAGGFLREDGIE